MGFDTVLTQLLSKCSKTKASVKGFVTASSWK
jgi:hypothetical protein